MKEDKAGETLEWAAIGILIGFAAVIVFIIILLLSIFFW